MRAQRQTNHNWIQTVYSSTVLSANAWMFGVETNDVATDVPHSYSWYDAMRYDFFHVHCICSKYTWITHIVRETFDAHCECSFTCFFSLSFCVCLPLFASSDKYFWAFVHESRKPISIACSTHKWVNQTNGMYQHRLTKGNVHAKGLRENIRTFCGWLCLYEMMCARYAPFRS